MIGSLLIAAAALFCFGYGNPQTCYRCKFDSLNDWSCRSPLNVSSPSVQIENCKADETVCLTAKWRILLPSSLTNRGCSREFVFVNGTKTSTCDLLRRKISDYVFGQFVECTTCGTTNCNGT